MLTSSLTVRRHSCRSIPRSTNPLPHYPLGSSSSNSFPHNPLSNPHLLNPVVSILYRNMRGGVGPALSSNPQFGSPPFIPFSFLFFSYISHNVLGPRTTRSSFGINSLRTLSTATGVCTVYPPSALLLFFEGPIRALTHFCEPRPNRMPALLGSSVGVRGEDDIPEQGSRRQELDGNE